MNRADGDSPSSSSSWLAIVSLLALIRVALRLVVFEDFGSLLRCLEADLERLVSFEFVSV